ncbi:MAG: Eco57I restriction-modification methylase domain-containing protein [Caulobacteraceae bacterium]
MAEEFFELDLGVLLGLHGHQRDLFELSEGGALHWLKIFVLVFRKEAFVPAAADARTFHQRALAEGSFYEERVARNLSNLVFGQVFPAIVRGIADAAPEANLQEVREAALVLLYRLLFILYAEDRNLLPVRDSRYDHYGLRDRVRGDVATRKDNGDVFSATAARYWSAIDDLCRAIDGGDSSIGLPPYNGGLFDPARTPLLANVKLNDALMADVVDTLSFEHTPEGRKYINYRDLTVQQLGSIYERLLEHEVKRVDGLVIIQPNTFARRSSGSYYTPDELVSLIVGETIEPLVEQRLAAFAEKVEELDGAEQPEDMRIGALKRLDPAERLLELKVCDPAMGSGHFLVSLVDYLADQVITAMAEAEALVTWADYVSPLGDRIDTIRRTILGNAEVRGWTVDASQLDDRHIIRRMVLKRCVYGVDKNPMAVELAKVALWLHTFTVGAPLSFLDHHLRCGDSLFGSWVKPSVDLAVGRSLFLHSPLNRALRAAAPMQIIEGLTDAEITEAHRSGEVFTEVQEMTAPLNAFLALNHAFDWLDLRSKEEKAALAAFLDGRFGDPVQIALGAALTGEPETTDARSFRDILSKARGLVREERFLNWQVAFPGVWSEWTSEGLTGGFDAVIGNPPWDRIKLQQVEWFAARRREIALAQRASDRTRMIVSLLTSDAPLAADYAVAESRADAATRMARTGGDYPLLSGGDVNLYSLFVERAATIVKKTGVVGLLTPSGIGSDKTAAIFFKAVSTSGRLKALYDFENRRTRYGEQPFFPDVDSRFKFCVFVMSPTPFAKPAECAFFLQDVGELNNPERRFPFSAEDFSRVNPNTGTAPVFRSRRDADLTTAVYGRLPVFVERNGRSERRAWPLRYATMFHMTNDSAEFRTKLELEEREHAYAIDGKRWKAPSGIWVPLYEGKMAQAFDHRAASVIVNLTNQHRPAQPQPSTAGQHADPDWLPEPQYWVEEKKCRWSQNLGWVLGFKEITAPTNERTFIAALFPTVGFGNKLPLLVPEEGHCGEQLLCANFNSIVFDYVTRQKVQGQTLNLFILEQLPVVPRASYVNCVFGSKSAETIVSEAALELTYTSTDMQPFARDMGYVRGNKEVKPAFTWDNGRRASLRAKLDAIFFHLYGITDREQVRYIYSTFPILERHELSRFGRYQSRDLCLAWLNALEAGDPDADIRLQSQ